MDPIEAMAYEMYDIDVDRPIASPGEIAVYRPWMQRILRAALEAVSEKALGNPNEETYRTWDPDEAIRALILAAAYPEDRGEGGGDE